jgi:hypothetical protein
MPRLLNNFLSGWMDYTSPMPTPEIFRQGAGLALISSALARRTWITGNSRLPPCVPNLYIMLVGPPGVGKDVAINKAAEIIYEANERAAPVKIARIGGESISKKGLIDRLADERSKQTCTYKHNGKSHTFEFHSLTFCIGELGTAMPEYDPNLVPLLNDLYNNKPAYEDTIRGLEVQIRNPHLTLLLGNQPDTLSEVFPEKTFRMGLTSRLIFVYSVSPVIVDIFNTDESSWDPTLFDNLVHDFIDIAKIAGPFSVERSVQDLINDFNRTRPCEVPTDRFRSYNTRRPLHIQKIAMCVSAAESNERVIRFRHWEQALELLFQIERAMPKIFDDVVSSRGFVEIYEQIKGMSSPVSHYQLSHTLAKTRSPLEVPLIIKTMISDGVLEPVLNDIGVPTRPAKFHIRKIQ